MHIQQSKILDLQSREVLLQDIPYLHAHRCIVKSSEARWKLNEYQAESSRVKQKIISILKERRKLMIKRDKHINTVIDNLILSQSHFTDLVKQDANSFYSLDSLGIHEKKKNSKNFKKIDFIFETSKSKEKKKPGDIPGAGEPLSSVLPIINVTPFSGSDQDAGRWIAFLESKFVQAGFISGEDVPGWMWVKAFWMNATTDAAMWINSTPHIRKITDKVKGRRLSDISDLERDIFTDEFTRRFELVVAPENETQKQQMVDELRQERGESLRDYFSRAQGTLRVIGADDSSEYRGVASSVNKFVIEMIVDRFVLGIYDEEMPLPGL
ncbi:hypothetical protein Golomagni_06332 [Golovinomyces magnicellulatus]|nr:hypothetical protein Golomagni_06332 [Golovinomyces magnicellulatus]